MTTPAEPGQERGTSRVHATLSLLDTATEFGVPLLDLQALDPEAIPEGFVDPDIAHRQHVLPLARNGNRLFLAVSDPASAAALDDIKFRTGLEPSPVLVASDQLASAIERYRGRPGTRGNDAAEVEAAARPSTTVNEAVDGAPVVKYVHDTLVSAIEAGASDVHFEPYENTYRIRIRVDGILHEARRPPLAMAGQFAARLKVMAQMDITERRVPQDGRIKLDPIRAPRTRDRRSGTGHGAVDIRASTLPTLHGEKIVLRILDSAAASLGVDDLGFEPEQRQRYLEALGRPQGMVLVTGPTGSGKTVTLYAGLGLLNGEDRNIATAEDPVEINVEGINQVQVNPKVGLNFATALRAFLRQDPDVVMVGEIRDQDTAETAVKAAQTGHLVLSTLHTNSAVETLTRLRSMGIPAFNLATSVSLIVAQRLARVLCPQCRRPFEVPPDTLLGEGFTERDLDRGLCIFDASDDGCEGCNHGYAGRTGIYEVVAVTPELQRHLLADHDSVVLAREARDLGYEDLRRSGLNKVLQGTTSLREINRVTARS